MFFVELFTTLKIHHLCFFVELFLTHMRYREVELANRVVKSDSKKCMHTGFTGFCCVSSEFYLALENQPFVCFCPHLRVFFR